MARVLVVDDDTGFRTFAADLLELAGHEVEMAGDGLEALDLLRKRSFHVMLSDLKMARMDGLTLLRRVREEQPELEVVVMTAHGTVATAVQAMTLGAFHYLQKPLEKNDELRLVIARAVERRMLRDAREEAWQDGAGLQLTWGAPAMQPVLEALRRVSRTDTSVLLLGESGVGKEVAARSVHAWSSRAKGPFIAVNCAGFSEALLESELFGHEKGAFTGAVTQRRGRLELADGGTFFLDEIGELKPDLQARLLRVIQEKSFERLGGSRTITTDVRFIAATNRDLPTMIRVGDFREDLYHRLAVFPVTLPPLRERREDILPLAKHLLKRISSEMGRPDLELDETFCRVILDEPWFGNVRELANTLERAAILNDGRVLKLHPLVLPRRITTPPATEVDPPKAEINQDDAAVAAEPLRVDGALPSEPTGVNSAPVVVPGKKPVRPLEEIEREAIQNALDQIGNRRRVADALGIGLRTLYEKMSRYKLGGKGEPG